MSDHARIEKIDWQVDAAAIAFISGASRPRSDKTIYQRANAHKVAAKVLSLDTPHVACAHVVYAKDVDVIALVGANTIESRIETFSLIRGLRNSSEHNYDFVRSVSGFPIISMFGRPPTRESWAERKSFRGWMFAESSESGPADSFAVRLLDCKNISFVATLAGTYDVGIFIEAESQLEFDKFIDNEMPMLSSLSRSDTFIVPQTNLM